jgi:hypothetical protein
MGRRQDEPGAATPVPARGTGSAARVKGKASAMASAATAYVLNVTDFQKWPVLAGSDMVAVGPGETYTAATAP